MQTCFFAISGVLPAQQAIEAIKDSIRKTYAKKGDEIVEMNLRAVDQTLAHLYEVKIPDAVVPIAPDGNGELKHAPEFVRNVLGEIIAGRGDRVPVSALPNDGTYPTGTTQFEKRNLATEVPVWDPASLHPVRQMRAGLPARGHSQQSLRAPLFSKARLRRSSRRRRGCRSGKG